MMNKGVECPPTAVLRVIYIRLFAYFIRFLLGAPSEICTTFICALTDNEYHCYYYYFYHQHHHHCWYCHSRENVTELQFCLFVFQSLEGMLLLVNVLSLHFLFSLE